MWIPADIHHPSSENPPNHHHSSASNQEALRAGFHQHDGLSPILPIAACGAQYAVLVRRACVGNTGKGKFSLPRCDSATLEMEIRLESVGAEMLNPCVRLLFMVQR